MADPILKINGTDYTEYIKEIKPTRNDLDSEGSGRNITTGKMYRTRIATKVTLNVTLLRVRASVLKGIESDLYSGTNYVTCTYLDAKTNAQTSSTFYTSSITEGSQVKVGKRTYYDDVSFELIER